MADHSFAKPKQGLIIDVDGAPDKPTPIKDRPKTARDRREKALKSNQRTTAGLPSPTGINPPGYETPEAIKAREDAAEEEAAVQQVLKPPQWKAKAGTSPETLKKRIKLEQELERGDWEAVASFYQHTGNANTIAIQSGLTLIQVNHLLKHGLKRLGMPDIRSHMVDQGQLNLDVAKTTRKQTQHIFSDDVATAIQERATQEAAAARSMLHQCIETGNIVSGYVKALFSSLATEESVMLIPKTVTLDTLETMTKVVDSHTRAMERAVKMVRLTQGEPTELIEHQIGAMLAVCTTRELEEAAASGNLPRRLTSRISGADPVQEMGGKQVIDVPGENGESIHPKATVNEEEDAPQWLTEIAPAEGESITGVEDDDGNSAY